MKINLKINEFIWTLLFLYPVLGNIVGGVGNAQRIMHVVFFVTIFLILIIYPPKIPCRKLLLGIFIYTLIVVTYYVFCTLIFTVDKSWGDFADFSRPFVYLMYLSVPLLYPLDDDCLASLFKYLLKMVIVMIIFSCFIYIPALYPLVDLYKGRMSTDPVIMHFFRWSGTFGYPSDFSFLLSLFIYWQFFRYVFNKGVGSLRFWLCFVVLLIGVLMTVSRGGIFSMLFMLGLCYLLSPAIIRLRVNVIVFPSIILMILGFAFVYFSNELVLFGTDLKYITSVIGSSSDSGAVDASSNHRLVEFSYAIDFFSDYFPFGSGANREAIFKIINPLESFYGYHFIKWGFIGFMLHMIFLFFVSFVAWLQVSNVGKEVRSIYAASIPFILSVPLIFGYSSAMSDRFKVVAVYYLVCGYVLSGYALRVKNKNASN